MIQARRRSVQMWWPTTPRPSRQRTHPSWRGTSAAASAVCRITLLDSWYTLPRSPPTQGRWPVPSLCSSIFITPTILIPKMAIKGHSNNSLFLCTGTELPRTIEACARAAPYVEGRGACASTAGTFLRGHTHAVTVYLGDPH